MAKRKSAPDDGALGMTLADGPGTEVVQAPSPDVGRLEVQPAGCICDPRAPHPAGLLL